MYHQAFLFFLHIKWGVTVFFNTFIYVLSIKSQRLLIIQRLLYSGPSTLVNVYEPNYDDHQFRVSSFFELTSSESEL